MAWIDVEQRAAEFNVVYDGPGLSGRTTNLQWLFRGADPARRSAMRTEDGPDGRTMEFTLRLRAAPEDLDGWTARVRFQTAPGAVYFASARDRLLRGADAVVFVADSWIVRAEHNVERFESLCATLVDAHGSLDRVAGALQYNKRDLPDVMSIDALDALFSAVSWPRIEASASRNEGVVETVRALLPALFERVRQRRGAAR